MTSRKCGKRVLGVMGRSAVLVGEREVGKEGDKGGRK